MGSRPPYFCDHGTTTVKFIDGGGQETFCHDCGCIVEHLAGWKESSMVERSCPKCGGPVAAGDECSRCTVIRRAESGLEFVQGLLGIGIGVVLVLLGMHLFSLLGS